MKREMKKTSKIALSAVFAALSVALMALVSIIPNLELALPAISGLFVAVIVIEINKKWALGVWAAVSVLSLIVVPNKEAAIIYAVFFGYYPVLKAVLESKTPRAVEYIVKILTFSVVMSLSYFLMVKFMGIDPDLPDFRQVGDTRDSNSRNYYLPALRLRALKAHHVLLPAPEQQAQKDT